MKTSKFQQGMTMCVIAATMMTHSALAGPTEDLEECRSISVESERLACFDAAYDQLRAAGMTDDSVLKANVVEIRVPGAASDGQAVEEKSKKGSRFGLPFFGRKKDETPETFGRVVRDKKGKVKSVTAIVVDVRRNAVGKVTVTLDNGQSWRPNEGNIRPKVGETAIVRRGAAGGYFLTVGARRGVRAVRVDDGQSRTKSPAESQIPVADAADAQEPAKEKRSFLSKLNPFGKRNTEQMEALVTKVVKTRNDLVFVTLDNGQVWLQHDNKVKIRAGDRALIKKGSAGGYFISVKGDGRYVRAERVPGDVMPGDEIALSKPTTSAPVASGATQQDDASSFGRSSPSSQWTDTPENFGRTKSTKAEREAKVKTLTQKVTSVMVDPLDNFIITLENGQVWQQVDGRLKVRTGDMVTIDAGGLGGHFLQVDNDGRSVRVRRVDKN